MPKPLYPVVPGEPPHPLARAAETQAQKGPTAKKTYVLRKGRIIEQTGTSGNNLTPGNVTVNQGSFDGNAIFFQNVPISAAPPAVGQAFVYNTDGTYELQAVVMISMSTPSPETVGATGNAGTSTNASASDHVHAMPGVFTNTSAGFVPNPSGLGSTYYLSASGAFTVPAGGGGSVSAKDSGVTGSTFTSITEFDLYGAVTNPTTGHAQYVPVYQNLTAPASPTAGMLWDDLVAIDNAIDQFVKVTGSQTFTLPIINKRIAVDASGGSTTVTLPDPTSYNGPALTIKKSDSSLNTITVVSAGTSKTIDGASSLTIYTQYAAERLVRISDGSGWFMDA